MGLNKQQAMALYFLLVTDSDLQRNLQSTVFQSKQEFFQALQAELTLLDPSAILGSHDGVEHFWTKAQPGSLDLRPNTIRSNIPALGPYGPGPCPKKEEQGKLWNAVKGVFPSHETAYGHAT